MRKPFVFLFVFLSLGILIGEYSSLPFFVCCLGAASFLLLSLLFLRWRRAFFVFLSLSFVLLGLLCCANAKRLSPQHIYYSLKFCREKPVVVEGVIVSDIQEKQFFRTQKYIFVLEAKRLSMAQGWHFKNGKVLVTAFGQRNLQYGDYVQIEGKLYPPFDFTKEEKFSYKRYLEQKGILAMMSVKKASPIIVLASGQGNAIEQAALRLRKKLAKVFYATLEKNEAALMEGMILGERSRIPRQLSDVFVRTGTAHILAISGMNVGIVAFLVFLLLKILPLGRRLRVVLAIAILIFHAVVTGAQPPVVRATVMACVFLLGIFLERETDTMNSLAFAGVVLLMANPQNLFNVGFQLSFVSVFAILYFYPILKIYVNRWLPASCLPRIATGFLDLILFSFVAWIGTIGMIAYYFQMITPITILANLVVVPLLLPIVIFGSGLLFSGIFWPQAAFLFALSAKVALNTMVGFIVLCSKVPHASIKIEHFSLLKAYSYYAVVLILFFMLGRFAKDTSSR